MISVGRFTISTEKRDHNSGFLQDRYGWAGGGTGRLIRDIPNGSGWERLAVVKCRAAEGVPYGTLGKHQD